jgi:hypothetical protein
VNIRFLGLVNTYIKQDEQSEISCPITVLMFKKKVNSSTNIINKKMTLKQFIYYTVHCVIRNFIDFIMIYSLNLAALLKERK